MRALRKEARAFLIKRERVRSFISFSRATLLLGIVIGFVKLWGTQDIYYRLTLYLFGFLFFYLGSFNSRDKMERSLNIVFCFLVLFLALFETFNWFLSRY